MATKNNPGTYDCYANAEPDEPIFILLGRDRNAPSLVDAWADAREQAGEDGEKVADARNTAASMREWLKAHDKEEESVDCIGWSIWHVMASNVVGLQQHFHVLTPKSDLQMAAQKAQAVLDDPDRFKPGAEITSIQNLGRVSA